MPWFYIIEHYERCCYCCCRCRCCAVNACVYCVQYTLRIDVRMPYNFIHFYMVSVRARERDRERETQSRSWIYVRMYTNTFCKRLHELRSREKIWSATNCSSGARTWCPLYTTSRCAVIACIVYPVCTSTQNIRILVLALLYCRL